jgi:hypothetical protein
MMKVLKEAVPNCNPNAIKDLEVAKKLLADLKNVAPLQ